MKLVVINIKTNNCCLQIGMTGRMDGKLYVWMGGWMDGWPHG
jgi:hypothetical protein